MNLVTASITSPVGDLRLVANDIALVAVLWPDERDGRVTFDSELASTSNHAVIAKTTEQLGQYFAGDRRVFDVPIEMRGTEFQQSVWRALIEIPFGETSTYGEQAVTIGRPTAVRAVGSANGRNPLSIVVPCHRVVGANGKLSGFAGGIDTKRWLLDHEAQLTGA